MEWYVLAIIFFGGLLLLMVTGMPIAFSFSFLTVVLVFFFIGRSEASYQFMATVAYHFTSNFILVAVPLFILMAEVIMFTGLSEGVFDATEKWLSWLPGGLAVAAIAACAVFAAIVGSSTACCATVALVAYPG